MDAEDNQTPHHAIWYAEMFGRLRVRSLLSSPVAPLEHFQTQKTALLFALLVLHQEGGSTATPLYRDDLAARLWPDADQDASRDRLSQALSWLRRNLETQVGLASGAVIYADRREVRLVPGSVESDAAEMERLLLRARPLTRSQPIQAAQLLGEALALYHGPLLPGIADTDDDLRLDQHRWEAVYQKAVRQAVFTEVAAGRLKPAIEYARRLLHMDAENETDCALLMRLLDRAGDYDGALRVFAEFSDRLAAQTLSVPSSLRRLAGEIQQSKERTAAARANVPLPAPDPVTATILPVPLTRFFGREHELQQIQTFLQSRETRLLTLLGPGGTGKTRLAVEAAWRFVGQDTDSTTARTTSKSAPERAAFFVSLENVGSASQITAAILRVLQQTEQTLPQEADTQAQGMRHTAAIVRQISSIEMPLLVLDNCEHLANSAETVGVLADLLSRMPRLSLIATSRVRMGVDGEQLMPILPLPSPHQVLPEVDTTQASDTTQAGEEALLRYPSVRMFLDRARQARLGFAVTKENREVLAALCERLEGIPLAIELCAAWASTLSPSEMLLALENHFEMLVSRRPDVPPRHRSLYAAVESSYLQLAPNLQHLFVALSVFRNGWTAETARRTAICESDGNPESSVRMFNDLAALQERSLIFTDSTAVEGATMRWRMLETLREFAWAQATEEEQTAAADRHAACFLERAETVASHLTKPGQRAWLEALEADHDNFQHALTTLHARCYPFTDEEPMPENEAAFSGLRLCIALDRFWLLRGYSSLASDYLEQFLSCVNKTATDEKERTLLARAHTALGRAYAAQGDLLRALAPLETALTLWRSIENASGLAGALMDLGEVSYWLDRQQEALALLTESEATARQTGDALLCAAVLLTLGSIALDQRDMERAEHLHRESLKFARQQENGRLMARALCNLGEIAREQNRLETARERSEQALAAAKDVGDEATTCYIHLSIGRIACDDGNPLEAEQHLQECFCCFRKVGTRRILVLCLLLAAHIADLWGQPERCAVLLGAGKALREVASNRLIHGEAHTESRLIASARHLLGDAKYEASFAYGQTLSSEAIMDYASRLHGTAR